MNPALQTRGLCKSFGGLNVTKDVDFSLPLGARYALIGPNGAGKTTLVNLITGALSPSAGKIFVDGEDVTRLASAARVKKGVVRTFQITSLFSGLTVIDNVALAVAERMGVSWDMHRLATAYAEVFDEAAALLEPLLIGGDARRLVRELPYGKRRLVEIAVALALRPRVLLLDEPAAGVPTHESGVILDAIDRLPAGISVLIIEHDMNIVFRFATRIAVLVRGGILFEGTPEEVSRNALVREVYLGETKHG